jgi:hypothetical protein
MGRVRRGYRLAALSWQVLREQPSLLVVPLVATVAQIAAAVTYILGIGEHRLDGGSASAVIIKYFPLYFTVSLISAFASAIVVTAANAQMNGAPLSLASAIKRSLTVLPQLIAWSLLSATVGTLLRLVESRIPLAARIITAIAGIVWSLATFLAVPVVVLEKRQPIDTVRRSSRLFRARWGEALVSDGVCGLMVIVVALPLMALAFVAMAASLLLGVVLAVCVVGGAIAVSSALNGIVLTAAYRFAAFGELGGGFTEADLGLAFRNRNSD